MRHLSFVSRSLVGLSILMMLGAYLFPMWSIWLYAPQYPEGLGMQIWINKIAGIGEFDIQNINLLNHYIGMASIEDGSIPEFRYMSYVLAYVIVATAVVFILNKRLFLYLGFINLAVIGCVGLFDFWLWEYNYGHHLDPSAPIQVPGMSYQPPLIGCKHLLNIAACSFPDAGGYLLIATGVLLFGAIVWEKFRRV